MIADVSEWLTDHRVVGVDVQFHARKEVSVETLIIYATKLFEGVAC